MRLYIRRAELPSQAEEEAFFDGMRMTCYDSFYPYGFFKFKQSAPQFTFAPITLLYGGNGSGKTTLLNVIAEKLKLNRTAPFNQSPFFADYAAQTRVIPEEEEGIPVLLPPESRFIASDDVFNHLFEIRAHNRNVDALRREELDHYAMAKKPMSFNRLEDYDNFKEHCAAKRRTKSQFVSRRIPDAVRSRSNGESAFLFFTETIGQDALYLLDEPENSLSPRLQLELVRYLESSVHLGNQFIIATHSPLILALSEARIYNLDADPIAVEPFEALENARIYYDFFQSKASLFEKK